jgi:hypothetical protein
LVFRFDVRARDPRFAAGRFFVALRAGRSRAAAFAGAFFVGAFFGVFLFAFAPLAYTGLPGRQRASSN